MSAGDPFKLLIEERDLELREGTFASGNRWRGIYSRQRDSVSHDPVYRYAFAEWWGEPSFENTIAWVLLNPSTGDTDGQPRPVLGYCRNRSLYWGHAGIVIVNLFAYRARDPKRLRSLRTEDAQGPDNDRALELITAACGRTVAAWGNGGVLANRGKTVRRVLSEPYCLVKNGQVMSGKGQPFFPRGISTDPRLVPLPESRSAAAKGSRSAQAADSRKQQERMTASEDFDGPLRIERNGEPIDSLERWRERGKPAGGDRQWAPGRSAMEEARAWIGLGPVLALLDSHPLTRCFRFGKVVPEARLPLDEHSGNTRNTDVLVCGRSDGGDAVLAIEAKADEAFDSRTVEAAATDPKLSPDSNLPDRVRRLCERLFGEPLIADGVPNDRFREVRYQLVHGPVAAALEAERRGASVAVFAVHEMRTDETDDRKHDANAREWRRLFEALELDPPADGALVELPITGLEGVTLLAGKATSDLGGGRKLG